MSLKKKSRAANVTRARRGVLGIELGWSDICPGMESDNPDAIFNCTVTHRNATQRIICRQQWQCSADWILETEFTWVLTVTVVYATPNRPNADEKRDSCIIRLTAPFRRPGDTRLSDAADKAVDISRLTNALLSSQDKNFGIYKHVEYHAICVGI